MKHVRARVRVCLRARVVVVFSLFFSLFFFSFPLFFVNRGKVEYQVLNIKMLF